MKGILPGLAVCLVLIVSIVKAGKESCDKLIQESEKLWLSFKPSPFRNISNNFQVSLW